MDEPRMSRADPEPSDATEAITDLVRRIVAGDPGAEAELVRRFSRALSFLLRRLTRDATEAEDLYQETFRLVIEKVRRGELREPERLPGFVSSNGETQLRTAMRDGNRYRNDRTTTATVVS